MQLFQLSNRFRPLYGVSLFLQSTINHNARRTAVFVPSTGYLYFYTHDNGNRDHPQGFRPLYGVSLFLLGRKEIQTKRNSVFVPSTGYLYFYSICDNYIADRTMFSSPLRGISISTIDKQRIQWYNMFSSPLRGISISTPSSYSP